MLQMCHVIIVTDNYDTGRLLGDYGGAPTNPSRIIYLDQS